MSTNNDVNSVSHNSEKVTDATGLLTHAGDGQRTDPLFEYCGEISEKPCKLYANNYLIVQCAFVICCCVSRVKQGVVGGLVMPAGLALQQT